MAGVNTETDSVEYEGCYLWTPKIATEPVERAAKRRRTTKSISHYDEEQRMSTVPLLLGKEAPENVQMRSALFDEIWKPQERVIKKFLDNTTTDTIDQVCSFIKDSSHTRPEGPIPSAMITVGPSNSTYTNIVRSVETRLQIDEDSMVVNMVPSQITNLKSALKLINSHAMGAAAISEEDNMSKHEQHGRRLNYDLQILHNHVQSCSIQKVILAFHDSETFDGTLLNDMIEVISAWRDRIPFLCLFGIKTSVELFQEKLRRSTIQQLYGVQFEVDQVNVDSIFRAVTYSDQFGTFWLGPGVSNMILLAQQDTIQGVASFTRSLQYAYMTHIFANPLSILIKDPLPSNALQEESYECVRNLDSFRQLVEELLDQKDFETVKSLLDDESFLHEQVVEGIQESKKALERLVAAIELLISIQQRLKVKTTTSWSNLYIKAMSGALRGSAIVKDTLLAIRRLSSEVMTQLLEEITDSPVPDILTLVDDLRQLVSDKAGGSPLRSEHDIHHASLRTTVVSQKVELSKHSASLSKQDLAYSKLVNRVNNALQTYLHDALVTPHELFLHEVLVYDLKSPHREVFAPKPRFAIERALTSPRDYLGCSCCKGVQHGLSGTHPATSLLYQLYLESGAIINISDLWSAFYTIIGTEKADDEEAEQEMALALFSRALAELKHMGMIKNSRKKADHLAKILWNGL